MTARSSDDDDDPGMPPLPATAPRGPVISPHDCERCDTPMSIGYYVHKEQVGAVVVHDGTRPQMRCESCDNAAYWISELQGYEQRAALRALTEGRADGAAMKFARKSLGLTRGQMARHWSCDEQEVLSVELDPIPNSVSVYVLATIALLYKALGADVVLNGVIIVTEAP